MNAINTDDPRYIIGIDLGTTNSVVSYLDTASANGAASVESFLVPQLVTAERLEEQNILPSFLYVPGPYDAFAGTISLPWKERVEKVIGVFARDHGAGSYDDAQAGALLLRHGVEQHKGGFTGPVRKGLAVFVVVAVPTRAPVAQGVLVAGWMPKVHEQSAGAQVEQGKDSSQVQHCIERGLGQSRSWLVRRWSERELCRGLLQRDRRGDRGGCRGGLAI